MFGRNDLFVGREADMRELARVLKGGGAAAIGQTAVASGMGGIGKTQLASEFSHRYGQFFAGGVYWLSFADPAAVPAEIATCGGRTAMDLPNYAGLSLEDQVAVVQTAWDSPLPRLLVLDNCEDPLLLARWRPRTGGCRVLATARNARWDPALGVLQVRLGALARAESIELLRRFRPELVVDDPDLAAIAEEVGDLPLALHLAGSYLFDVGVSPTAFLQELRAVGPMQHAAFTEDQPGWLPTEHERHVGRTFQLSFGRLRPEDPPDGAALMLLARAASFAPGVPIPTDVLVDTLGIPEEASTRAWRAVGRLVSLGLLEQENRHVIRLHRMLSAFVQVTITDEEAQLAVEQALARRAREINQDGFPLRMLPLRAHLNYVEAAAAARSSPLAAYLANSLGYYLQESGDLAGARPLLERSLAIREKVLGPHHPETAASFNNLGRLLQDQGDLAGARPLLERSLAIREKILGPDHPDIATSLNTLGFVLYRQGDLTVARPLLERVLGIHEKALGPDHLYTAQSVGTLGLVLQGQGDLAGARVLFERALAIYERILSPDHPFTASMLNNLGGLLQADGDLIAARSYLERALIIREATLGPDHPDAAASLNNLGALLHAQGDLDGSRSYYERALAICERVLGPDHPNTLLVRRSLQSLEN